MNQSIQERALSAPAEPHSGTAASPAATKPPQGPAKSAKKRFIVKSIFITHAQRIGWIRTTIGGFLQYVSVFEFIFLHLTTIIVLYKWMLTPFFKLKRLRIRDYILLDRGKIGGMCLFDRINCEFCGYANGTARIWNAELDELAGADLARGNPFLALITGLYALCLVIFFIFTFIFSKILFLVISLFLGLHRADTGRIMQELKASGWAQRRTPVLRQILRLTKVYAASLATNLEQIESGWCPLKHAEREGNVYSDHHENFIARDELPRMIEILEKEGSVSPRKPKY